jgi:hypothetical protein
LISSQDSQVFHGVLPSAQFWSVPERIREAPTTAPAALNRIREAPPPEPALTSELET